MRFVHYPDANQAFNKGNQQECSARQLTTHPLLQAFYEQGNLKIVKFLGLVLSLFLLAGCTTGRLEYVTPEGETKYACETEYTWEPSVDKYAVEYILSYCAKQAAKKGNIIVQKELLSLDLTVVEPPKSQRWSYDLAESLHKKGQLSDKQYGYIIAYMDLGHDKS